MLHVCTEMCNNNKYCICFTFVLCVTTIKQGSELTYCISRYLINVIINMLCCAPAFSTVILVCGWCYIQVFCKIVLSQYQYNIDFLYFSQMSCTVLRLKFLCQWGKHIQLWFTHKTWTFSRKATTYLPIETIGLVNLI